jgi:molecular chaperone Hsp33
MEATDPGLEVRTYFVREKNALLARADFGELYADLVLHEVDGGISHGPAFEELLRDALAALTLHCAARPRNETWAWTIHTQDPLANVFVTGDNASGTVIGTVFSEDVKNSGKNLFYAQCLENGRERDRLSIVEFQGSDLLAAVESYYAQSEQRPARFFRHGPEDIVMVIAQPDCDLAWLEGLDEHAIRRIDHEVTLSLLEQRSYRLFCGCTQERMMDVLLPVMRNDPEGLFAEDASIRMRCPRCGTRHLITREAMEARVLDTPTLPKDLP